MFNRGSSEARFFTWPTLWPMLGPTLANSAMAAYRVFLRLRRWLRPRLLLPYARGYLRRRQRLRWGHVQLRHGEQPVGLRSMVAFGVMPCE